MRSLSRIKFAKTSHIRFVNANYEKYLYGINHCYEIKRYRFQRACNKRLRVGRANTISITHDQLRSLKQSFTFCCSISMIPCWSAVYSRCSTIVSCPIKIIISCLRPITLVDYILKIAPNITLANQWTFITSITAIISEITQFASVDARAIPTPVILRIIMNKVGK